MLRSVLDPEMPLSERAAIQAAIDEIERLRAVLDAVDDLHEPTSADNPRCSSCGDWPCPTHLIVCDECEEARRG